MATRKKKTAAKKAAKKKAAPRRAPAAAAPRKKAKAAPAPRKAKAAPAPPPPKPEKPKKAPLVWKFKTKSTALGIYVEANLCWVGNEAGEIFAVTHQGEVMHQFKLPEGVKCLIADEAWRYAGCNNGNVYDLSGRVPRVVYEIGKETSILWLDIFRGNLAVSDDSGGLTVVDAEDNLKWKKRDAKDGSGWMVRADAAGIYHGGDRGVHHYDWDGKKKWTCKTDDILFGWQEADDVYAGTMGNDVVCVSKSGKKGASGKCDSGVLSCAAAPGGKYMFGGTYDAVFCFDQSGKRLWKMLTGCGSALSMQYHDDKLYIVTGNGFLACIDASEGAIEKAMKGQLPKATERKAPVVKAQSTEVERTTDTSKGVVVECVKEGSKLRVKVISDGYHNDWFCQFPKDIREEGAKYVVDQVLEASQGGFYRVLGDIKRLE